MEPADDELICRYRDCGDTRAFEMLFHRHSRAVFHLARGMVGQSAMAEEILQETFLAVARKAGEYCSRGYFRTWLLRITRNLCLNAIEARRVRAVVGNSEVLDAWRSAKAANPLVCAEQSEQMDAVGRAMMLLPERQREALLLYAFDDMEYREIAQVLDVPLNTVKTLIHRARAALAESLPQYREDL